MKQKKKEEEDDDDAPTSELWWPRAVTVGGGGGRESDDGRLRQRRVRRALVDPRELRRRDGPRVGGRPAAADGAGREGRGRAPSPSCPTLALAPDGERELPHLRRVRSAEEAVAPLATASAARLLERRRSCQRRGLSLQPEQQHSLLPPLIGRRRRSHPSAEVSVHAARLREEGGLLFGRRGPSSPEDVPRSGEFEVPHSEPRGPRAAQHAASRVATPPPLARERRRRRKRRRRRWRWRWRAVVGVAVAAVILRGDHTAAERTKDHQGRRPSHPRKTAGGCSCSGCGGCRCGG